MKTQTIRLTVDGVTSPILVGGPGELDDSTEAVVFVHGNPDRGSDWLPLLRDVADFARVVARDMPGFGAADMYADQSYTVASYANL